MKKMLKKMLPAQIIMSGFFLVIIIGSIILSLPVSSANGKAVPYIDALFTATTSVCVTGLVTLPTVTTWSVFGQVVILILIQIGGIGVITAATGLMLLFNKKFGIANGVLIGESFNLNSFEGIEILVKRIFKYTFIIEGIGTMLYMTVFVPEFGIKGVWISVFTSVSAFCNAGIDIISENSLCNFVLNPVINITTMFLIIFGGIGFIVMLDLGKLIKNRKRRHLKFLSLHSKIALSVTSFLIVSGAALFFIFEYYNPQTIGNYSLGEKAMVSLFQSVTTRTAGFATVPQENFTDSSALISMILMFVGGSPAGTAGGVKTVTFFVVVACALAVIKNKRSVDVFNRQLTVETIKKSMAVFTTSFCIVIVSTVMLSVLNGGDFLDVIYETVSATGTVGLSRNFTASLNFIGKIIIIFTMFFGRIGPLSLALAFVKDKKNENVITNPVEKISVG